MAQDLITLQQEIHVLEKRKAELQPLVKELRAGNDHLERLLSDVKRGVLFGISWWKVVLTFLLLVAASIGTTWFVTQKDDGDTRQERMLQRVHTNQRRLLITSKPPGARVQINGGPTVGTTPLLYPVPKKLTRFTVDISSEGYHKVQQVVATTPQRGAHLHAELQRRPPAAPKADIPDTKRSRGHIKIIRQQ
ncbi:MAG: PEGA domain-containing protein [Deltaproteobacteria bacterium]|nr:PEGA domain-containing protein [Deltaproteobacteria bacterium]